MVPQLRYGSVPWQVDSLGIMKKLTSPVPASPAIPMAEIPVKERILGAAFKAFSEDGYADTSTLDIATRAKVSKRDLYANRSTAICVCCHLFVAGAALQRVAAQHGARG